MRRFEDLRKVWLSGWERQYLCFRDRDPNILAWEKNFTNRSLFVKKCTFMQEAVPAGGAMAAVLGLDAAAIEQICRETAEQTGSEVSIANYNCPGQIVISG